MSCCKHRRRRQGKKPNPLFTWSAADSKALKAYIPSKRDWQHGAELAARVGNRAKKWW